MEYWVGCEDIVYDGDGGVEEEGVGVSVVHGNVYPKFSVWFLQAMMT